MDTLSKKKRSELMSKIRSVSAMERNAKKFVSKKAGIRLRHQPKGIHGRPDFANKSRKVAVFLNGCFFHQPCPRRCSKVPKTNRAFWRKKFMRNAERQKEVKSVLRRQGWKILTYWEHSATGRKRK